MQDPGADQAPIDPMAGRHLRSVETQAPPAVTRGPTNHDPTLLVGMASWAGRGAFHERRQRHTPVEQMFEQRNSSDGLAMRIRDRPEAFCPTWLEFRITGLTLRGLVGDASGVID